MPVPSGTPFGSFVNHNHFAGFVAMAVPLALGLAVGLARSRRSLTPASLGVGGVGLLLALVQLASLSRGGAVALVGGLVAFSALGVLRARSRRSSQRVALIVASATVVALCVALWLLPAGVTHRLSTIASGARDPSGSYRLDMATATLEVARAHPFVGVGLGGFADAVTPFKPSWGDVRATHAESDVLEFLAEAGLLGGVVLGIVAVVIARAGALRLTTRRDPTQDWIALGAGAGAAALLLHSLADFDFRIPANAIVFSSLLGVATRPVRVSGDSPALWGSRPFAAVAMIFAALCLWRCAGAIQLDSARAEADPRLRIERLDRTVASHPYLAEAHRLRAMTLMGLARAGQTDGRLEQAIRDIRTSLRLRPEWAQAWADLGAALYMAGRAGEAAMAFDEAVLRDPTNLQISVARAVFLVRTGRRSQAVTELERVERANPTRSINLPGLIRQWLPESGAGPDAPQPSPQG
jgi:O-antigen ligase